MLPQSYRGYGSHQNKIFKLGWPRERSHFPVGISSLFILKWGKEHDGREFGVQRQTEILSLLTKGKRRQTKPAGESLMFWKALWKWKPKVCIKADLKELHSRSWTTCLHPPCSRITAFQMGLEHITCCFCTRYVLILHIYCPIFVLLWLTCDSFSEHHAAPAAKQIL